MIQGDSRENKERTLIIPIDHTDILFIRIHSNKTHITINHTTKILLIKTHSVEVLLTFLTKPIVAEISETSILLNSIITVKTLFKIFSIKGETGTKEKDNLYILILVLARNFTMRLEKKNIAKIE